MFLHLLLWTRLLWAHPPPALSGPWLTVGDDGCQPEASLLLEVIDGELTARVTDILEPGRDRAARCASCPGSPPIIGLTIASGLRWDGDRWSGGVVLDPVSGRQYTAQAELLAPGVLDVRGYLGHPLLGRSVTWLQPDALRARCGGPR